MAAYLTIRVLIGLIVSLVLTAMLEIYHTGGLMRLTSG